MKTIWVNGCFDVLHMGHIQLLTYAKSIGDKLIVGVDTDDRVKKVKGESRPFNSVEDRVKMLYAIRYVDMVVEFSSDIELETYIKSLDIDIMVVGDDYKDKVVIGSENCNEVKYFTKLDNYSTTSILKYEKTK